MATVNRTPTTKPRQPSVKELTKINRKLKKQVQKENRKREDIARLKKENDELAFRLYELRNPRTDGECC